MLRIRLQRRGRRKRPLHHIVVADSRKPRDGRIIEDLGRFDNVTPKNQLTLNRDRAIHWLKQGAQPTDTVRSIFKKQGIMYEMHLMRWGKSEEEIETALTEWREAREAKEKDVPTRKERQKALLEAEEKEYQKQLKKKAEQAAKEKAKQEALASDEEEEAEGDGEEAKAEADEVVDEEAEAAQAEEETAEVEAQEEVAEEEDEAEAQAETSKEEEGSPAPEATDTEEPEAEAAAEESEEESADEQEAEAQEEAEETEEEPEVEAKEEDASDDEDEEETKAEADGQTSSDMLAKEAIEHIENTPLEDLKGFVTDDEDRVTVQRAWESKQEEG